MHTASYIRDKLGIWLVVGMWLRLEKPQRPPWRYGSNRRVVTPYGGRC